MPQFSSVPKFIFEKYVNDILAKKPVKKDDFLWEGTEVLFTDANDLGGHDYNGIDGNLEYTASYKQSLNTDSYIQAPQHLIVTKGGKHINAYAKTEGGYQGVKLQFDQNYDEMENQIGDIYQMKFSDDPYPVPTDDVKYTVNGTHYGFTVYDAFSTPDYKTVDVSEEEKEVYLRKDSSFFEGYNSIDEYRGFINRHKLFTLLGELYPPGANKTQGDVNLVRYLFKDFVIRSVPENNRTDKFLRFIETVFDQVYHKYYEYQKNLPSIIDYEETYPEFLDNIISIYDLPYIIYDYSDVDALRRMARFSPVILKKKGSFASIVAAGRTMAGIDTNVQNNEDITNYEWWFEVPEGSSTTTEISGYVPDTYYEIPAIREYELLNKCTNSFYNRYNDINYDEFTENKVLSPHYKVELDLSCRPPDDSSVTTTEVTSAYTFTEEGETESLFDIPEEVFSEKFANNAYRVFEDLRPITKKSHYNILFSPLTDFSGKKIPLYKRKYENVGGNSLCTVTQSLSGASIHRQLQSSDLWEIEHNLKTAEPIVQVVDLDGNMMYPSRIYNESNHDIFKVYAEFEEPVTGYALVRKSDSSYKTFEGYNFLSSIEKEVITQFYDIDRELYFPEEQTNLDNGISVEGAEFGYMYVSNNDLVWEQNSESTEGTINHNFVSTGTLVQVYDENGNVIYPSSVTLQDINNCKVTFDEPTKGRVILKEIGSLNTKYDIINKLKEEGAIMKLGNGGQLLSSNYGIQNEVKTLNILPENISLDEDNNMFIEGKLDKEDKFNIKECAIYDSTGDNLHFYSQGNNIHKHEEFTMTLFYRINYDNLYYGEL